MTLTELAEVAVPRRTAESDIEGAVYRLLNGISCNGCGDSLRQITLDGDEIVCVGCDERICILCGCVDSWACDDGCSWMLPGICSTHDGDVRIARLSIPTTPTAALTLLN